MTVHPDLAELIEACIDSDASVRENASEDLKSAHATMSVLVGRLHSLLRNHQGEISEKVLTTCTCSFICHLIHAAMAVVEQFRCICQLGKFEIVLLDLRNTTVIPQTLLHTAFNDDDATLDWLILLLV